jgi:hypothetical protein
MTTKRSLGLAAMIAAMTVACSALVACSGDDDVTATHSHGTPSTPDATVDGQVTPGDDGGGGPVGQPLCGKYGGFAFVQSLADSVNTKMAADCRVSAHFTGLDASHAQHMKECTESLFGTYFQCSGVTYDKDSKGNPCRDLQSVHRNMNLRSDDFKAALEDTIAAMREAKMSDDDIGAIAPTFIGIQGQIATKTGKGNTECTCADMKYDGGYCGIEAGTIDSGTTDSGKDTGADTGTVTDSGAVDANDAGQAAADAADEGG